MELTQSPLNYKPEVFPATPYNKARQEWDERIGTTVNQAKNWRMAFLITAISSLGLIAGNIIQITQRKVIPMVITVGAETGEATVLGKPGLTLYQPGEPQIRYFLVQFIRYVRTVPVDPVVIKSNWLQAYKFLRREASQTLNLQTNEDSDSPLKRIGTETVTIQPISVLFVPGSNSYQARWTESVFDKNGQQKDTYTMTGIFTIEFQPPTTEDEILVNPLGIFIKSFQWNRDLGEK